MCLLFESPVRIYLLGSELSNWSFLSNDGYLSIPLIIVSFCASTLFVYHIMCNLSYVAVFFSIYVIFLSRLLVVSGILRDTNHGNDAFNHATFVHYYG